MSPSDTLALAEQLVRRAAKLRGRFEAHETEYAALLTEAGQAKGRLELAPSVEAFLTTWQARLHARNVGVMEQLLTALLQDVIPGEKRATFSLSTERGAPALDIELMSEGEVEDILDGHGGAVTNVVSAGLRFIALSRSGARKFIALDEGDCWLPVGRVGLFSNVLAGVSESLGVQTLIISHHDVSNFEDVAHPIRLTLDAEKRVQVIPSRELPEWKPEQPGIRSIRLINVRRHADTTIYLSPGITALVGDADVGKSTVISALRAISYGESSDSLIRHKAPSAEVQLQLEEGKVLSWRRARKGSPKTKYTLFNAQGEVVREENMARGAPGWVTDLLGIAKADELDIQVGSQKKPIFLLDEPAAKRAAILSVGRESGYLANMLETHRDEVRLDRERVRKGEERLGQLVAELKFVESLNATEAALNSAFKVAQEIVSREVSLENLKALLVRAAAIDSQVQYLSSELSGFRVPEIPSSLKPSAALQASISKLEGLERATKYSVHEVALPVLPELHPIGPLLEKGKELARLEKHISVLSGLNIEYKLPELKDAASLHTGLSSLEALVSEEKRLKSSLGEASTNLQALRADLEKTVESLGGVCPLCNQPASSHDFLHEHTL